MNSTFIRRTVMSVKFRNATGKLVTHCFASGKCKHAIKLRIITCVTMLPIFTGFGGSHIHRNKIHRHQLYPCKNQSKEYSKIYDEVEKDTNTFIRFGTKEAPGKIWNISSK